MTERKRAGTGRRSLTEAAAPSKRSSRPIDDTGATSPQPGPDQIALVEQPPTTAATTATEPSQSAPAPSAPSAPAPGARRSGTKYTATLDDDTVDAFEQLTRVARRRLGRHVDKIEVLRTLLLLAADDSSLRDRLVDYIGRAT